MAILGIDEVGRGPFAGPLVVGAVILPEIWPEWVDELRDSKKIGKTKRRRLSDTILEEAPATGFGWVSAAEIDRIGIEDALRLGARRAVRMIQETGEPFSQIIMDGDENFLEGTRLEQYTSTVIKGDNLIKEVSAASIIAKVARDDYMEKISDLYPEYGFERHVGYGTELHRMAIENFGLCPEHRRSVKPIWKIAMQNGEDMSHVWHKKSGRNTTDIGAKGEDAVCEYLEKQGHNILMRNVKTRYYEIDIVSTLDENMYFTEVKYRRNDEAGGGLAAIGREKLEQMRFAAECFVGYRKDLSPWFNPVLAVAEVTGEDFRVRDWFELD